MSDITLTRSDSSRNMRRFYWLNVQPDLVGNWNLWPNGGASAAEARCAMPLTLRPKLQKPL
jgi:predicted DNA-binding WGR domain protein